jgi:hypothetical protein
METRMEITFRDAATALHGMFFGAMLNKYAPVRGGANMVLMQGERHGQ